MLVWTSQDQTRWHFRLSRSLTFRVSDDCCDLPKRQTTYWTLTDQSNSLSWPESSERPPASETSTTMASQSMSWLLSNKVNDMLVILSVPYEALKNVWTVKDHLWTVPVSFYCDILLYSHSFCVYYSYGTVLELVAQTNWYCTLWHRHCGKKTSWKCSRNWCDYSYKVLPPATHLFTHPLSLWFVSIFNIL